jgi:hypothetical protein
MRQAGTKRFFEQEAHEQQFLEGQLKKRDGLTDAMLWIIYSQDAITAAESS